MNSSHRMLVIAGVVCGLAAYGVRTTYALTPGAPCTLLTQVQVSGVLGVSVGAGEPISTTGCQWATPSQPNSATVRATLVLSDASAFEGMKTPLLRVTKTAVTGIGDDAIYTTIGKLTTLAVKKGAVAFVVRIYGIQGQAQQMAMEKTLALDVVAKL